MRFKQKYGLYNNGRLITQVLTVFFNPRLLYIAPIFRNEDH
jgi:hypothetical protein